MADPFSVFTGALTVADVCIRVGRYLRSIQRATKHVAEEIKSLEVEIETFNNTYTALRSLCSTGAAEQKQESSPTSVLNDPCIALWKRAADLVQEGQAVVEQLREVLQAILGSESSPKFQVVQDVRRAIRMSSKNEEYEKLRARLTRLNMELSTMLTAIDLTSNSVFRSKTSVSLEQLPEKLAREVQDLGIQLRRQLEAMAVAGHSDVDLQTSIATARAAIVFASLNEHFYVQKPDTSIWTGREKHLNILRDAIQSPQPASDRIQKRFVVYGISGAGKTQFCCKFAQDYRESFWGIFWIDASSEQNARESWKRIAKIGGKDLKEEAGKYWLSNLQTPWLLIIDSADNSEESIKSQFPSGDRGCILITTRNPRLRIHATVGSLALDRLEENEANELLRKATNHTPWDGSARTSASSIARHLGYLPLALVHAGRAIFHQLCTLQDYIPFFNRALDDFRKNKNSYFLDEDDDDGMGTFTTFDIIYSGLEAQTFRKIPQRRVSEDAIELINTFAFFHHNDISLNIFFKAGQNLRKSSEIGATNEEPHVSSPSISLLQRLQDCALISYIKFIRPVPVFPQIVRAIDDQSSNESRARKAMDLLVRLSLLSESSDSGSYSMHPLVHLWVRKRLRASAQALWCAVAGDVLASAIKLPPMPDETGDQDFYIRLLPHINQVRSNREEITRQLLQNCQGASYMRRWVWLSKPSLFTTVDALNSAKYSRVYMECFKYSEAEELQRHVRDHVVKLLGRRNVLVVTISLALSKTLWLLARAPEAQELQEDALEICKAKLGETHSQTLKVMDALGETYWQRGWLKEAKALHQSAINGMEGKPNLTRDRLKAMTHLGHVHEWYTEFDEARDLHERASDALTDAYGPDDFDTLIAKDSLAMTLLRMGGVANTRRAHVLMQDIHDRRVRSLGEEHLYSLWAACNLARTLTVRGSLENDSKLIDDAKLLFHDGIAITRRNLGPKHLGTLMGRRFLADALVAEKKYDEAEAEYKDISESQRSLPGSRAGTHRDRLTTLEALVDCCEIRGKFDEAVQVCITIIRELDGLGGQNHPWRVTMAKRQEKLEASSGAPLIVSSTEDEPTVPGASERLPILSKTT